MPRKNPKISSPCSPKAVYKVISGFSDEKKELVRVIGFEGLLELPLHRRIGHRFSLWLLTKVEGAASASQAVATTGKVAGLPFYLADVSKVFGIPCGGRLVWKEDHQAEPCGEAKAFICNALGLGEWDGRRILDATKNLLKKKFGGKMGEKDRDTFKIAFVMFVTENLLAPREDDYVCLDYLAALQRPDEIHMYNWSEYVIRVLLNSACKVQASIAQGRPVVNLYGCILFLQIFYLDNLDFDHESNLLHDQIPRCKAYDYDTIKRLAKADRTCSENDDFLSFGRKLVQDASNVCYKRCIAQSGSHINNVTVDSADGGDQDMVFNDVNFCIQKIVCQVCGHAGVEDLIMFCNCGNASVHQYCSDPIIFDATLIDWSCDECQAKRNDTAAEKSSNEVLNQIQKQPSHAPMGSATRDYPSAELSSKTNIISAKVIRKRRSERTIRKRKEYQVCVLANVDRD